MKNIRNFCIIAHIDHGKSTLADRLLDQTGSVTEREKQDQLLDGMDIERPVGIQIFGANLESMLKAVDIVEKTKPDIIDINFGCPVKKVVCKGAGAGILKDIDKMETLTKEMVRRTCLPVTVKTRLGWDEKSIKIATRRYKYMEMDRRRHALTGYLAL